MISPWSLADWTGLCTETLQAFNPGSNVCVPYLYPASLIPRIQACTTSHNMHDGIHSLHDGSLTHRCRHHLRRATYTFRPLPADCRILILRRNGPSPLSSRVIGNTPLQKLFQYRLPHRLIILLSSSMSSRTRTNIFCFEDDAIRVGRHGMDSQRDWRIRCRERRERV